MKVINLMLVSLLVAGCGDDGVDGLSGSAGQSGPTGQSGNNGADGADGDDGAAGLDGENGLTSLIKLENAELDECPSKAGVLISSGVDLNGNDVLDADEIDQEAVLCGFKKKKADD